MSEDQWSFPLTRAVYESEESFCAYYPEDLGNGSGDEAIAAVAILVLPVAVDVILLPITLPRDLIALGLD